MNLTQQELEMLWQDKAYGILTRPAIEIVFNRRSDQHFDYVVFIDVDNIHNVNDAHAVDGKNGYEITNALIRHAFEKIRKEDLLVYVNAGRHLSGDEVVFYINGNPEAFCEKLQLALNEVGLSATMAYSVPLETYEETVDVCVVKVQAAKKLNQRGSIRR